MMDINSDPVMKIMALTYDGETLTHVDSRSLAEVLETYDEDWTLEALQHYYEGRP